MENINNNNKIKALKEQRVALVAKGMRLKEEYLTTLLKQLDQPYMVFDNKLFIIPTTSPMFELLPQTSFSDCDFKVGVKTSDGKDFEFKNFGNYSMLLVDLTTYKIDPVKDTVEYINEQKELI